MLSADAVKAAARDCRFTLVGLTPAVPLDPGPLERWLAAGYAADMDWMARRLPERLDPAEILPGARTVIALAIAYHRPAGEGGPVARYARGRDYHYAHRDRMKALRRRAGGRRWPARSPCGRPGGSRPVSYTHLTLPTK